MMVTRNYYKCNIVYRRKMARIRKQLGFPLSEFGLRRPI